MTHAHQFSETVIAPELWICAPSRALTVSPGDEKIDHARIDAAVSTLRELGWSVNEAANVRKVHKSFAGTDAERAAGFEEAMCAPEADLVLALRGGSGAARLLERIDGSVSVRHRPYSWAYPASRPSIWRSMNVRQSKLAGAVGRIFFKAR